MTSEGELHAHCQRPVFNVTVESQADAIVLEALNASVEELCQLADKEKETGNLDASEAYFKAARILDKKLRAALERYAKKTQET